MPFFIPMLGCPSQCVYCDQRSISGQQDIPAPRQVEQAALAYAGPRPAQLAFYGGSFTALPWPRQQAYLQAAQPAIQRGIIDSIRLSTRPDALSSQKLAELRNLSVSTVELGIQSFDAGVLQAAGRAYSPQTALQACLMVRQAGLELGVQLMTGLPQDTPHKSLGSLAICIETRADFLRLYPTLVLQNTPLARLYAAGSYQPQELTEAVQLAAHMLALALLNGIAVIRVGMNPSRSLEQALLAGPYHPAFGQLAYGALKLQQAIMLLKKTGPATVKLHYPTAERPLLFGQKNEQWRQLQELYPLLIAQENPSLPPGALQAQLKNGDSETLTQADFLRLYVQRG